LSVARAAPSLLLAPLIIASIGTRAHAQTPAAPTRVAMGEGAMGEGAMGEGAMGEEAVAQPKLAPPTPISVDVVLDFVLAKPFEGARSLGDWGYGLMLSAGGRWRDLPFSVGLDLQAIRWGHSSSLIDVQLGDTWATLERSRLDQSIVFDSWLRFEPFRWRVQPYLEGFVGLKMLDTKYSLSFLDGDGTTSTVTDQASASNYGFGAGMNVLLAYANDRGGSALSATLGFRALYGGRASFTRAPDSSSDRTISFDVPTHSTEFMIGFLVHAQPRKTAE
jgi:hypothetical protein